MDCPLPSQRVCTRAVAAALVLAAPLALSGCEALAKLRRELKGEGSDEVTGQAGLRVEVEPPDGISILLDGARVASMSPFHSDHLTPGKHMLEVRAMGYHTFQLPLHLVDGETVTIPVALRPRRGGGGSPAGPNDPEAPPEPPKFPDAPGPALPPGVKPITLTVATTPSASLSVNGKAARGKKVTVDAIKGNLGFGDVMLPFEVGGKGLLVFIVPQDGATWEVEGKPLRPGQRFRHNKGVMRIKRSGAGGDVLSVLLKR